MSLAYESKLSFMKKLLFALAAVLACATALAQGDVLVPDTQGFIYIAGGPALPVGDFSSGDTGNEEAGNARTGFTLNLHGGYYFTPGFGVKATGFYSRHGTQKLYGLAGDMHMGRWQYYGLTVGPVLRVPLTYTVDLTVAAEAGMVNAGSPEVTYLDMEVITDDWSTTVPLKGGAALHFTLGESTRLLVGADYLYMKPKFSISARDQDYNWQFRDTEQHMGAVNVFAGVGISF